MDILKNLAALIKVKTIVTMAVIAVFHINQLKATDLPCGKSILGGDLFKSGIHFQECNDKIKGFYLSKSENESHRGSPIRVCFSGEFVEEENNLFFDT